MQNRGRSTVSKAHKLIFALFCVMLSGLMILPAFADGGVDYDNLPVETIDAIEVEVWYKDLIRKLSFGLLKGLAWIVDQICMSVEEIMGDRAYNLIASVFPDTSSGIAYKPIVIALLSFAVCFAGICIIFYADKNKVGDTLRNIALALIFIVAMPSFIAACNEIRVKGINQSSSLAADATQAAQNTNRGLSDGLGTVTTNGLGTGVKHYIGEQLLAQNILDINASQNKPTYYVDNIRYNSYSLDNLNINEVLDSKVWNKKVLTNIDISQVKNNSPSSYVSGSKLSQMFGYETYYNALNNAQIEVSNVNNVGDLQQAQYNRSIVINLGYKEEWKDGQKVGGGYEYKTVTEYEYIKNILIPYLKKNVDVINSHDKANFDWKQLENCSTLAGVENFLKSYVTPIIYASGSVGKSSNKDNYYVTFMDLMNSQETATWDTVDKIYYFLTNNFNIYENIYAWKVNFWQAFISLAIVGISLLFAGIKLAGMLYDMLFMNVIAPIVIATDVQGTGRAKKIINSMLSTYIVFFVVIYILKIYIIALGVIFGSNLSVLTKLILTLAGAKFVIDGPDIIAQLTGVDAGVKSGYGTLMGLRAATSMASGATRTATRYGSKAAHIGSKASAGVAGGITGSMSGGYTAYRTTKSELGSRNGSTVRSAGSSVGGAIAGGIAGTVSGAFGKKRDENGKYKGNAFTRGANVGAKTGNIMGTDLNPKFESNIVTSGIKEDSRDTTENSSPSSSVSKPINTENNNSTQSASVTNEVQGTQGNQEHTSNTTAQADNKSSSSAAPNNSFGNAFGKKDKDDKKN